MTTEQVRVFLAIPLTEHFREVLLLKQAALETKGFRWTKPENLHITLAFIGEVPAHNLPDLVSKVEVLGRHARFSLHAKALEPVRRRGKIDMLWATFETSNAFTDIASEASSVLKLKPQKPVPHVTLARSQRNADAYLNPASIPFSDSLLLPVTGIELWSSVLKPGGSHYTSLHRWELN